jgi:Niemann-Pick C1 protein
MEEVGTSITLTTLTSTLAFGLGCLASIPAVFWLCLYAFPTVLFVYLYQITFFVSAIVLDENRIKQDRKDLFMWCRKKVERDGDSPAATKNIVERFTEWYADVLLQPAVKIVVVVLFAALLGLCAWSASQLEQSFDVADVMPDGSYASDFIELRQEYSERNAIAPYAYFRNVNQSQTSVQNEMIAYVNDLLTIESIPNPPPFFWVEDFQEFVEQHEASIGQLPFNDQLDAFLAEDGPYSLLYGPDIVRDEVTGDIIASRVRLYMDNVEVGEVNQEIDALEDQAAVAARQPANKVRSAYSFFLYDDIFQIWEFYATSVEELILTTILGVVSVTVVSLLFIPHYTAAIFVLPLICILYVDLLGVMQWGGVTIDPVSYVTCVMSIGLLVDFVVHMLLRYYECPGNRREKTVAMLKSMGVSILTGGISTFLGTIPLAFSTSTIFSTIFIAFLGLSTLGVGHALILLPVVLSTIGPEDQVARSPLKDDSSRNKVIQHKETTITA